MKQHEQNGGSVLLFKGGFNFMQTFKAFSFPNMWERPSISYHVCVFFFVSLRCHCLTLKLRRRSTRTNRLLQFQTAPLVDPPKNSFCLVQPPQKNLWIVLRGG